METKAVSSDWSNVSQLVRENDSIKIVNYLDGFLIEERDSRTQKKWRSHKTNNSEQNHYYPFGLRHGVYDTGGKKDFSRNPGDGIEPEPGLPPVLDYVTKDGVSI
ncbi:MAG: hypothetical protein WDA08_11875 [Weeksellaceae bacterium]